MMVAAVPQPQAWGVSPPIPTPHFRHLVTAGKGPPSTQCKVLQRHFLAVCPWTLWASGFTSGKWANKRTP